MSGTRRWMLLTLVAGGLGLGCGQSGVGGEEPRANEREGRSEVLRGLMAAKEQPEEADEGKRESGQEPSVVTPGPPGQGGSGRPESTGQVQGQVTWVGDNELLIREPGGAERDLEVNTATRIVMKDETMGLQSVEEGDQVRVSYDEGRGGWVARRVEVLRGRAAPAPSEQAPGPGPRERAGRGGPGAPSR